MVFAFILITLVTASMLLLSLYVNTDGASTHEASLSMALEREPSAKGGS